MTDNNQVGSNENAEILRLDIKQAMSGIYGELQELFFNHYWGVFSQFENFEFPEIVFSDEVKTEDLGEYYLEEAIVKIEPMMDQIRTADGLKDAVRKIEGIIEEYKLGSIKKKSDCEDYLRPLCAILRNALKDGSTSFNNGDKKVIEAINILKNVKEPSLILGEFEAEKNSITLYTKANQRSKNTKTFRTRIMATLAHELFHVMHCHLIGKEKWTEKEDEDTRLTVIESLAKWAEYCWCIRKGKEYTKIVDKIRRGWEISDFPADPYSGAKVFDSRNVLGLDFEVLEASKKDWDEAYALMEMHRNEKTSTENDDGDPLFLWREDFSELTRNAGTKEWAAIHPHCLQMSERDNLALLESFQQELEQKGLVVTRILCRGYYYKRNNELVEGASAFLYITNNKAFDREHFVDLVRGVSTKYVNSIYPLFGAISKADDTGKVYFMMKGEDEGSIDFHGKEYEEFDKYSTPNIFQDIFERIGVISPLKLFKII